MNLELSDDQRELAEMARGLLDRHAPLSLARAELEGGCDPWTLWGAIAGGGWYAVGLDADDPFGVPGLCLLAREVGAHVAPSLLVDTAVAVRLTADVTGEDSDLLPRLRSGESTAALALLDAEADWGLEHSDARLLPDGGGYRLHGVKVGVQHADRAEMLLVLAEASGVRTIALVRPDAAGVEIRVQTGLDPSSRSCTVEFDGVWLERPETSTLSRDALDGAFAVGAIASAAEGLGAASHALDEAVQYSLEREQFGRPIARFQAVQHMLAEAHVLRETAWSSVLYAAAALQEQTADAGDAFAVAKAHTGRASREVVETAAQVFGGVAFTWEHDLHLFQRRVLACERRFGDSRHHETRLGTRLALTPAMSGR
jgi:alkylation response protein AidB-like acyl-CoA dehydrogenase